MPFVLPPANPLQMPLRMPPLAVQSRARLVRVKDIAFTPSRVTVGRGSSVTWRFLDGPTFHNVRFLTRRKVKGSRDSRTGSFTTRFRTPGRYRYRCTLHPLVMKGVVVVAH